MKPAEKYRLEAAALIAATGLTRFLFRSHYLYDIDSVNFALALKRFDTTVHQPHPPGYFLYICLGRLASLIFHDANSAMVAISIVFSCAAVAMICILTDSWFGDGAARFAGLIFLFSPLAWFHGTVALTYIVEAFFSALVGYLCWRADRGNSGYIVPAAVAVGAAAGFRPSSILFLTPLLVFSMRHTPRKQALRGIGALILTLLAWFIPMLWIAGPRAWLSALISLWLTVPGKASIFNSSPLNSIARAATIAGIYFLCFGSAALLALHAGEPPAEHRSKVIFTRVWIAPGLLFFTFVYLKFVNSGYLLIVAPPIFAWLGFWANSWYEKLRFSKPARALLIGVCAAANTAIFIFAPLYCSYREVRRFESELNNILTVIPRIASPKDTMIVGLDSHFLGYRHAGYYLPDYLTVQFPEMRLSSGMKVFAMRDRDTALMTTIDTNAIRNFVIFPLPQNSTEDSDYMTQLRKRIPSGDLRLVAQAGNGYAFGPINDLHCLFPRTTGDR